LRQSRGIGGVGWVVFPRKKRRAISNMAIEPIHRYLEMSRVCGSGEDRIMNEATRAAMARSKRIQ
jgi:hypothetical protein